MGLEDKVKRVPKEPGVYLMQNKRGQVIYIGKAKSLRSRVRSYFQESKHQRFKTKVLVGKIADFEYIITDTEVEALILENNLIKKYNPKYNIQLKDDKTYPYIKVTVNETYPRVFKTRVVKNDGARYFGPYTDVRAVNNMLELIQELYPLRTCKQKLSGKENRECLNYHIEKCMGPCVGEINPEEYQELVDQIIMILEGKENNLKKRLEEKMEAASQKLEFEEAAKYRDQINAIEKITQKQKVVSEKFINQDIIALADDGGEICLQLLIVRNGRLIGKDDFIFSKQPDKEEVLGSFIQQYYDTAYYIPEEILIDTAIENKKLLAKWLSDKEKKKVTIKLPKKGDKKKLVEMAYQNAKYNLKEHKVKAKLHGNNKISKGVKELKQHLSLPTSPYRITGFDISTIQGTDTVASLVIFENGEPKKSDYRRFKIKSFDGQDDFAAMKEVLNRRYSRLLDEDREFPDLILIDGGKGQLNAAVEILENLGIEGQPIISLAKREEEVFVPGEEEAVVLPRDSEALYLIQRVRDEAHRFAVSYHRKLRSRRLTQSMLDDIPGVGKKKREALLKHFGSLNKVKLASEEELMEVEGVGPALAGEIREYLEMNLREGR